MKNRLLFETDPVDEKPIPKQASAHWSREQSREYGFYLPQLWPKWEGFPKSFEPPLVVIGARESERLGFCLSLGFIISGELITSKPFFREYISIPKSLLHDLNTVMWSPRDCFQSPTRKLLHPPMPLECWASEILASVARVEAQLLPRIETAGAKINYQIRTVQSGSVKPRLLGIFEYYTKLLS